MGLLASFHPNTFPWPHLGSPRATPTPGPSALPARPHQWWLEFRLADKTLPPGHAPGWSVYLTPTPSALQLQKRGVHQRGPLENKIPVVGTGKEAGPGVGHAPSRKRQVTGYIPFGASDSCGRLPALCFFTRPLSALSTHWPRVCWARLLTQAGSRALTLRLFSPLGCRMNLDSNLTL